MADSLGPEAAKDGGQPITKILLKFPGGKKVLSTPAHNWHYTISFRGFRFVFDFLAGPAH